VHHAPAPALERFGWLACDGDTDEQEETTIRPRVPFKNLTGPVPPFSITDGHAAVLVVDVQRFTVSPDHGFGRLAGERGITRELGEYYEQVEQAVPNMIRLVEACRAKSLPVIFTRLIAEHDADVTPQARVTGFWTSAESRRHGREQDGDQRLHFGPA
jgi:hypothetical protein